MKITVETKINPLNNHTIKFTVETTYEDITTEEISDILLNLLQSVGYSRQNIIDTFKDYE